MPLICLRRGPLMQLPGRQQDRRCRIQRSQHRRHIQPPPPASPRRTACCPRCPARPRRVRMRRWSTARARAALTAQARHADRGTPSSPATAGRTSSGFLRAPSPSARPRRASLPCAARQSKSRIRSTAHRQPERAAVLRRRLPQGPPRSARWPMRASPNPISLTAPGAPSIRSETSAGTAAASSPLTAAETPISPRASAM